MRTVLYIIVLAAMLFAPVDRLDVAKLEPVEAVAIYLEDGQVVLQTDGESIGIGNTAQEALADLKENTLAVVYLDTADYLLIGEGAEGAAQDLQQYLRESVQIGKYNGGKVKEEAEYLDIHGNAAKTEN